MSMRLMVDALKARVGNQGRKLVLIKLADNANDEGVCWPSYQTIADDCEMGRSTVKAHIKALAEMGFIEITTRNDGKSSNQYRLTIENGSTEQGHNSTESESNPDKSQPGQNSTRSESSPHPVKICPPPGQDLTPEPVIEPVKEPEEQSAPSGEDASSPSTDQQKIPRCPHKQLLAIWQEVLPEKRQHDPNEWKPGRTGYDRLAERWREGFVTQRQDGKGLRYETTEQGVDWWRRLFHHCRNSEFLMEDCRPFCLEWIAKKENFLKLKEGAWHD